MGSHGVSPAELRARFVPPLNHSVSAVKSSRHVQTSHKGFSESCLWPVWLLPHCCTQDTFTYLSHSMCGGPGHFLFKIGISRIIVNECYIWSVPTCLVVLDTHQIAVHMHKFYFVMGWNCLAPITVRWCIAHLGCLIQTLHNVLMCCTFECGLFAVWFCFYANPGPEITP